MEAFVMDTKILPPPIRERFHSPRISVQERDGGLFLLPLKEGSGLLGIAQDDNLTVEKFLTYKRTDKELDK